MAITTGDLYSMAKELSCSDVEVQIRTSISKSYYCAYHSSLKYLGDADTNDWIGGDGGVHSKLISEFILSKDFTEKGIGHILNNLKKRRVIADYYLTIDQFKENSESTLIMLDSLLEKIKS